MNLKTIYISDIKSRNTNGKLIGHFVPVATNYKDVFSDYCKVKVCGGPVYKKYFQKECLALLPFDNFRDGIIGKLCTIINAVCLFFKARNQIIVMQQCGSVTSFVAIALFYWFTSRLYLIQYNTEPLNSRFKRLIYMMARWKIDGVVVPNERVGNAYLKKKCVVTDYIYYKKNIEIVPYKERKWDFGFVGSIFKDKGVLPAASFLASKGYRILVAGYVGEPDLEVPLGEILSSYPSITYKSGYIDDELFNRYIKECKYCVLNYQGTYFDRSSGVVLDVIFNGTPVVGRRCSALSKIEEYEMGALYDEMKEVDYDSLFEEQKYDSFLLGIKKYVSKQNLMKEKLRAFILSSSYKISN